MGLSGLGYNGHVFWDTELWMYPALLVMHPVQRALVRLSGGDPDADRRAPAANGEAGDDERVVTPLTGFR